MRIIRPLDDMAAVTTSDAPDDAVAAWEPEGRDLLGIYENIGIKAVGNTLYFAGVKGGVVTFAKQDLATGVITKIVEGIEHSYQNSKNPLDAVIEIDAIADSDIAYVTFFYNGDNCRINLVNITSGVVVNVLGSTARPIRVGDECVYSTGFAVGVGSAFELYAYNTNTGTSTSKVRFEAADFFTAVGSVSSHWQSVTPYTLKSSDGSIYLIASGLTKRSATTLYGTVVLRVPPNWGQPISSDVLSYAASNNAKIQAINEELGHLIYSENNRAVTKFLSSSTLTPIAPPAGSSIAASSIQVHGDKMFVRSISTSPTWTAKLLSNYTNSFTLPEAPNRGAQLAFADDYIVQSQNSGVALHDSLNNYELVAQQNPNVTKGDTYIYADHVYEALVNNNDQPDEGAAKDPSPTWLDLGAINRLRMFDNKIDSVTRGNGSLNITIDAKQALNGIALFNVTAATVQITMTDGTYGLVYDTGEVLMRDTSQIRGWYDWFFSSRPKMRDMARIDLPTFPNAIVEVTLTGDNVSLGEIVLGRVQKIGETQYGGTSVGIIDSSIKERDDFGNFVIAERPFSKRVEFDVHVPTSGISGVQNILASYRAKPVVYVGAEGEEALVVFGFYRDFQINYTSYSIAASTITVEGL